MPRQSDYTPELALEICGYIASGLSVRQTAYQVQINPDSVYTWLQKHPAFADQYARAKEQAMERMADELIDIADTQTEDPQRSKLRVDTRKWIMSKLAPKKYGDRQVIASDSEQPFSVVIRRTVEPK